MKAVILGAGSGRRLFPLTKDRPKCLLEIGRKTILDRILENLGRAGIRETVLVVGFCQDLVRDLARERGFKGLELVVNAKYESTNTAYSLRLALSRMDSDFLLINGDLLFDGLILRDLIAHPQRNCVVVDSGIPLAAEEVKVQAVNGYVLRIGKDLKPEESLGEAIGICKFSREVIPALSAVFDDLERHSEFHHYFEKGIELLCEDGVRFGILLTDRPWVEIDSLEDWDYAVKEIRPKLEP